MIDCIAARSIRRKLAELYASDKIDKRKCLEAVSHSDAAWDIAHPVNRVCGVSTVVDEFLLPLCNALHSVRRRDDIFIFGKNRCTNGGDWVASTCHYVGNFAEPMFGIPECQKLVFLRSGEFYRIDAGKISHAKLILDFPDLMRQAGCSRLPHDLGTEMLYPAPATHDGILPCRPDIGNQTLNRVEAMFADLHAFNPKTFESRGQTGHDGHWHEDLLWFGPSGVGSNFRWNGFVKDHRRSFLEAFPDRAGGNHYCRIGDGNYAAASGWPSMTMTHLGDYLGIKATGRSLTLRVMDFYRCQGGQIIENWVYLDYGDLLKQMGFDLFANIQDTVDPSV